MAKWGEGDPRWIVEECVDATNVNNWHWMERDVSSWSLQRLRRLLLGVKVTGSEGVWKLIFFYEWQQRGSWLGTSSGGVKYRGTVEVNDLSDENDLDVSSTSKCSSSSAPCPTGVGIPTCSFNLEENFQTSAAELYRTFINQEFVQVFTRSEAVVDGCLGGRFLLLDGSISGAFTQLVRRFRTWPSENYASVSLDLEERGDGTALRLQCGDVPSG
uniref:Activator of Hsp90 ATPase AHSA1-like N-terminal domain-containing protein n=1 Tax=Scophthalmus maximus TaxID=52904 RepID=A0A8D3AE08_SCOMX